ncbi:MAG: hypothetical protein ABUL71_04170 [Gemmatimonadota bacterium]
MPSDPRAAQALAALAQPIAEFRGLVRDALTRAEAFRGAQHAGIGERAARAGAELGRFGEQRIDPARFAVLFAATREATPAALTTLGTVIETLSTVIGLGDDLFVVDVPSGGHLDSALATALGEIGRAFGAVILTDLIRGGRYDAAQHDRFLDPLAFTSWNSVERRVAPPLVVTVDGADLRAGELMAFADGREKIILLVRGECAPASLARCITPGTLVLQAHDCGSLERVALFDGPAIAAIVPDGAATFCHDPAAGRESWKRLAIDEAGRIPKRAIGGASVWQMTEELSLLADLARIPMATAERTGGQAPQSSEVVDRIAAWLLGQSELPGT